MAGRSIVGYESSYSFRFEEFLAAPGHLALADDLIRRPLSAREEKQLTGSDPGLAAERGFCPGLAIERRDPGCSSEVTLTKRVDHSAFAARFISLLII
jgi:hypothetical protein